MEDTASRKFSVINSKCHKLSKTFFLSDGRPILSKFEAKDTMVSKSRLRTLSSVERGYVSSLNALYAVEIGSPWSTQ